MECEKNAFMHATLVYASPLSGRTHQIRVHGLSIGHPLVGDEKYGHETEYREQEATSFMSTCHRV